MVIGVLEVILNIILSIILVKQYGIIGVVGATAIASLIFIVVMIVDFSMKYIRMFTFYNLRSYWKIFAGMIVIILFMISLRDQFFVNSILDFCIKVFVIFISYTEILLVTKEAMMVKIFVMVKTKINEVKSKRI